MSSAGYSSLNNHLSHDIKSNENPYVVSFLFSSILQGTTLESRPSIYFV